MGVNIKLKESLEMLEEWPKEMIARWLTLLHIVSDGH
jgi:hypothetical protein